MVIGRRDVKHRPGTAAVAGRGIDAAPDAPLVDGSSISESVTGFVNHTITSIRSLFQ
jgi:hypothetical protein